jgi:hypothetical protein
MAVTLAPRSASAYDWECLEFDHDTTLSTTDGPVGVPSCATFYPTGRAIHLPSDTATTKYGTLFDSFGFTDRHGHHYDSSVTEGWSNSLASQVLVRATIDGSGSVSAVTPVLYVMPAAVLKLFTGRSFIGLITNMNPPAGVKHFPWFEMDFYQTISNNHLWGVFQNYRKGVQWQHMRRCRVPIMHTVAEHHWYEHIVGPTNKVYLSWSPAMHATDSELVLHFSSGVSYMRGLRPTASLLLGRLDNQGMFRFTIHGNPMNTPYLFGGTFKGTMQFHYC